MFVKVEGADAVATRLGLTAKAAIGKCYKAIIQAANTVKQNSRYWLRSGQPGYFTGSLHDSIEFYQPIITGNKIVTEVGPGVNRGLTTNEKNQAYYVHEGFRRHFVGYRNNQGLQQWAREHGLLLALRNRDDRSGGLMVGGPGSVVGRGLQYMFKGKAQSESKLAEIWDKLKYDITGQIWEDVGGVAD